MSKVKFGEVTLPVIRVVGTKEVVKGVQRDVLTFHFEKTAAASLEELIKKLGTPSQFSIISERPKAVEAAEGVADVAAEAAEAATETFTYRDYTILTKRSIESELVKAETSDAPAEYKDIYVVGFAQMTYTEKLLAQLQAAQKQPASDEAETQ